MMKLCALLHESSRCPTCGGMVDSTGRTVTSSEQLIFPDKEGKWDVGGRKLDREQLASLDRTAKLPAGKDPNSTVKFTDVLPTGKKKKGMKGMTQALLRFRRDMARQDK